MSTLSELLKALKTQKGRRYRLIRLDSANVTSKKLRGYEFVRKEDPEVKGTILEKHQGPDGLIRLGNMALGRISAEQYEKNREKVRERTERRLRAIRQAYEEAGENVKRELGKAHKSFNVIIEKEE